MLEIANITFTPMQRAIVSFAPATPQPETYTVIAEHPTEYAASATVPGTANIARLPKLRLGEEYEFTVLADGLEGAPFTATVATDGSFADLLQQAVFDAIYDAAITDFRIHFHNGKFQPVEVVANEIKDVTFPALEVCAADLTGVTNATKARNVETWSVPIRIWATGIAGNPQEMQYMHGLRRQVQRAIDASANLGLQVRGVIDYSYTWRVAPKLQEHAGLVSLELTLTVPVQRMI